MAASYHVHLRYHTDPNITRDKVDLEPVTAATVALPMRSIQSANMVTLKRERIDLMRGWPSPDLLPAKQLSEATQRVLASRDSYTPILEYGPDKGHPALREALASWLSDFYRVPSGPDIDRICITGGASQNVANVLQSFTDPVYTRAVWVVAPCYYLACGILADGGFHGRMRSVGEGHDGVDLEELAYKLDQFDRSEAEDNIRTNEMLFKEHGPDRKFYRHIIYCVPTCSNPSGKTMSVATRRGLVLLARKHDALVICDDVYDCLQWPLAGPGTLQQKADLRLPRLVDIDLAMGPSEHDPKGFGHAISNGSFSKIMGPGVRTGWVEASPAFVLGLSQTGSTVSGGAPSQLAAGILGDLVQCGQLPEHIDSHVKPALRRRHALLAGAIVEHLTPLGVQMKQSSLNGSEIFGGYFVWLKLNDGLSAHEITEAALEEEDLVVGNGNSFAVKGDEKNSHFDDHLRLCFAWESESNLVNGVIRLGALLRKKTREKRSLQ